MNADYFCFSRNQQYYAIDVVRIIPVKLNHASYSILKEMQDSNRCFNDIKMFANREGFTDLQALYDQDILFHHNDYYVNNSFRELNISLIPTLSCNLNCKYCYSRKKHTREQMTEKTISDAIDFFCDNFSFSYCRIDFVSGGEPLYDKCSLMSMVHTIYNSFSNRKKKPLFWLCTNGMLLDEEIVYFLDKNHFNLGVSVDGPEEIHNANRIDLAGNGTYQTIVNNINNINNNRNLSRSIKNLWSCAVITSKTNSLVEVMKNSYKLGFRNLQMKLVWSNDDSVRSSFTQTIDLYEGLSTYLFHLVEEDRVDEFLSICNENDTYDKILLRIIIQSGVTRRCNAGVNKFSVSPDGKLYPCDSFLGIDEYSVGDIYNGLNEKYYEFSSIRNKNTEKCKNCWARFLCGGDCYYHAFINNGDPRVPDDTVCYIIKEISKMCIALVVDLYQSFPQKMQLIYTILAKKVTRMEPRK